MGNETLCPCGSKIPYSKCCGQYHQGAIAKNALALMRSRYAAYRMKLPDYIIDSTHPASQHYRDNRILWRNEIVQFCRATDFLSLDILDAKEETLFQEVTFRTTISQGGEKGVFSERSLFAPFQGRLLYLRGDVIGEGEAFSAPVDLGLLMPLAYLGETVLEQRAKDVEKVTDEVKKHVAQMIETMKAEGGVGLASPQVHDARRIFVMHEVSEERELGEKVHVVINPSLTFHGAETWRASEGCLSIPGIRHDVERFSEATLEFMDLEEKWHKIHAKGWQAKVIQHEFDHIEGILFIERLSDQEKKALKPKIHALKRRFI